MRGTKVPENVENEFRQKLIELGVISQAAKAVGIPISTGMDLARRAEKDEAFVRDREAMRARVVPELEARLMALAEKVTSRVEEPDLTPEQLADIATTHELKSFSYQNPKPQYFRGLVDLYGKLTAARKDDGGGGAPTGPAVVINMPPVPVAK